MAVRKSFRDLSGTCGRARLDAQLPCMSDTNSFTLDAREIGAAPIVRHFFDRLDFDRLIETYVPDRELGRPAKLSHARALSVMVMNALLCRRPLYAVPEWLERHVLDPFGLAPGDAALLNDDRIGRALDRLYTMDPASLMTAIVTKAVREFDLDLSQIHNDTTTVTFSGAYEGQQDKEAKKRPPLITFGHNKDHRPDLKQLLACLTITYDGAVPVHYKTYDGNVTDDKTHRETWSAMSQVVGRPDFTYVADSKLCTRENMEFIASRGGYFVTVLPRSRREDDDFREFVQTNAIPWEEVRRESNNAEDPPSVYEAFEPPLRSVEGYRIVWYRSSVKAKLDQQRRAKRIAKARDRIQELEGRSGAHRFRSVERAEEAVRNVLQEEGAERWLKVEVIEQSVSDTKQVGAGRPGKETLYRKTEIPVILLAIEENAKAIAADGRCDGLFAMVTNKPDVSPKELLEIYKYQPFLEKRHEQLKSVLSVAPVFLKKPERVAALLFVYFLAVLVFALIERELRRRMVEKNIEDLRLYPEERPTGAPTTDLIFQTVLGHRRSTLTNRQGEIVQVFHDPLDPVAKQTLKLLGVNLRDYGVSG
jgi:transposase